MSVSKKVRFEVFKRDNFQCQYCGNTPPKVVLELDHVLPKAKKGKDNIENLVTSCFDCNRGKSDGLLSTIPKLLKLTYDEIKDREDQLKEYNKLLISIRKRQNREIKKIEVVYSSYFPDYCFSDSFKESIRSNFLNKFSVPDLQNIMHSACQKIFRNEGKALKYFCGILWRKIKGDSRYG